MIAVLDAGTGNIRSVLRALEAAGAGEVTVTSDPDVVARASRLVVPGQGAFGDSSRALFDRGGALASAVRESIAAGKPFLGVCLGLQVLFESSDEAPGCPGLGVFRGRVVRFPADLRDAEGIALKVPHVGWNRAVREGSHPRALPPDAWFYFVHSYYAAPEDPSVVAARAEHGVPFACAVARDNVLAVQFHPEKSQAEGLALLRRWLEGAT